MSTISVMMFGESVKKEVTARLEFDPEDPVALESAANLRISITSGDDIGAGTVVLPFAMLSSLIAQAMGEVQKQSQIILPEPGIVGVHKVAKLGS